MTSGRCLCGAVTWEIDGELELAHYCHCSMCRRFHGTGASAYAGASEASFRFTGGTAKLRHFESSPGHVRTFCGDCGSAIRSEPSEGRVFFPIGGLEGDVPAPIAHIYAASKAPWVEITDDLPRFDVLPPGFDGVDRPARPAPRVPAGTITGGCLCGDVAYEIEAAQVQRVYNCHCSRCRRARGTPHASNLFTTPAAFRWVRGESLLASYKLPEAVRFAQSFCSTCGAKMPRVNTELGYVAVPAGSLDGDPGSTVRPQAHIFVGSKAPWFTITDALPQHDELPA